MAIFNRITNLARGVWLAKTRSTDDDPLHAAVERELATPVAPRPTARATPADAAQPPAADPASAAARAPVELDDEGNVKRTL